MTSPLFPSVDPATRKVRAKHLPIGTSAGEVAAGDDARFAAAFNRENHVGQQTAASISDLREAVEDYVAALLAQGSNVTLTYADNGAGQGSLSIASTGGTTGTSDPEVIRDTIGIALVGVGLVSVAVNDAGDTLTISTTATANSTDAQLRDRTTHTGEQPIATVTGLQAALDARALLAHTHPSSQISDAGTVGRNVFVANDAPTARAAMGAGTSSVPQSSVERVFYWNEKGASTGWGAVARETGWKRIRWSANGATTTTDPQTTGGPAGTGIAALGDVWERPQ